MITVLLLGAGGNAGMNFIKCLRMADAPYKIVATDVSRYNLATCCADAKYLLPTSTREQDKLDALRRIIDAERPDVMHAQPDAEVEFLCRHRCSFECTVFPHSISRWSVYADKCACQSIWAGTVDFVSAPYTDLTEVHFQTMLERGGKVWVRALKGAGSKGALPCLDRRSVDEWVRYWCFTKGYSEHDFMVSEYLPGKEYAVQTFWAKGDLIHSQARERVVHFFANVMPSEQSSTPAVARTVSDRDVYDAAYDAIKAVEPEPHGIYCVDLRRNWKGLPFPTEVNYGRFFTTSDFFARLGINTPASYVRHMMTGEIDKCIENAPDGMYWMRGLDREPMLIQEKDLM